MVAATMYRSPGTRRSASNCSQLPRLSTSTTPATDSSTPAICLREAGTPKHSAPMMSIHTGMPEPTSVTFSGVEVCSARYCSAL